jgi:pyrroloquinoline quinone biosynthesis protein E
LELANTQYLGHAFDHRDTLMPTAAQLDVAREKARAHIARLRGQIEVLFVMPDYFSDRPRACMGGWGTQYLVIAPDGLVLPCHAAATITLLADKFERVGTRPLRDIWLDNAAFTAYRGTDWMDPTCASCERRDVDFGGCRCQAFLLTGRAEATDPACGKAPAHDHVTRARLAVISR